MKQVIKTGGQVAKKFAGVEAVEIKATIPDRQIDPALRLYNLELKGNNRYIYFFDTPGLNFFKAGVICRARRIVNQQHDSTIKFRPVMPDQVSPLWRKYHGFKFEADASENGVVKSASLTMGVAKGIIKKVAAGKEPISRLFAKPQQKFLLSMANRTNDVTQLIVMGPLRASRWKFNDPALPWAITAELWHRDDGARLFEVSIKVPLVQAAVAIAGFKVFLAEAGAEHDEGQQTKTRWALDYFAGKFRQPNGKWKK